MTIVKSLEKSEKMDKMLENVCRKSEFSIVPSQYCTANILGHTTFLEISETRGNGSYGISCFTSLLYTEFYLANRQQHA